MTWNVVAVVKPRKLYTAAGCLGAMGWLAWCGFGPSGPPASGADGVQPLLLLEGRAYAIVATEPGAAGRPPVIVLRDEASGRLERRRALIQVRLEDNVTLNDVLAELPLTASQAQAQASGTYLLRIPPEAFSKVHRTLLTDWRVARLGVPQADLPGSP